MSKIAMVAKLVAKEGKATELGELLGRLVEAARDEVGTELYVLSQDAARPEAWAVFEVYADQAALDVHSQSATMAEVFGAVGGLLAEAPELTIVHPVAAKGIAL